MAGRKRSTRSRSDHRRSRPARLARQARRSLADVTHAEAENVTALERSGDRRWKVTVELLELARIPATDDLIGSYEAEIDEEGTLLGYRRLRRYPRNRSGPEEPTDAKSLQADDGEPEPDGPE